MSTLRQIEANRRNAQKSTGPTSVTGKAASSMNALKTGIHAKSLVLASEKLADLEQLIADFYRRHNPSSPEACSFVDDLIYCEWSLRRLRNAETQMWQYQNENRFREKEEFPLGHSATNNSNSFSKLQYRLDATRRARLRALQALDKLKAEAASAPPVEPGPPALQPPSLPPSPQTTSPQIGFVPPTPIPAPPQSADAPPNPAPQRPASGSTGSAQIRCTGGRLDSSLTSTWHTRDAEPPNAVDACFDRVLP